MKYTLDAENQSLGRLASKIAVLLRGKNDPKFASNILSDNQVIVENVKKIKLTGNKLNNKVYYHYSGFPGGLKVRKLSVLMENKPDWVLRQAVYRMLPKNKQRAKIIKNLHIK